MPADEPSEKKDQSKAQNNYDTYMHNDWVKLSNALHQHRHKAEELGLDELLKSIDRVQGLIDKQINKKQES